MKDWKLILIPLILVILAVVGTFVYNWWHDRQMYPGKPAPLETRLQGVADWAKDEQGLELLGEYTFVTTSEIDKTQIKKVYAYHLSDGSVYGHFSYREEQEVQNYILCGLGVDYVKAIVEAEAQYLGKEMFFDTYGFFAIGDDPEALMGYYTRCSEGCYYRE